MGHEAALLNRVSVLSISTASSHECVHVIALTYKTTQRIRPSPSYIAILKGSLGVALFEDEDPFNAACLDVFLPPFELELPATKGPLHAVCDQGIAIPFKEDRRWERAVQVRHYKSSNELLYARFYVRFVYAKYQRYARTDISC